MSVIENLKLKRDQFFIEVERLELVDQGVNCLWGPSGCGKSSMLNVLVGLEPVDNFRWILKGEDLAKLPIRDRRLGVVFQDIQLFPHLTAQKNIEFAAKARNLSLEHTTEIINQLGLAECIHQKPGQLSGGEQQRVALARALAGQPRFLLLDEPFSSLDQALRLEARKLLKETIQKFDIPVLLITHEEADVKDLAKRLIRMEKGKIIECTTY